MSKELKNIMNSISEYNKKHKNKTQFFGSFMAFKGKDFNVIDDRMFAYGPKDTLIIDLEEMLKMIKKEKEDFINW